MWKVEEIEEQIRNPPEPALVEFRQWDAKFEADVLSGKLDVLGQEARRAHAEGNSTKL